MSELIKKKEDVNKKEKPVLLYFINVFVSSIHLLSTH